MRTKWWRPLTKSSGGPYPEGTGSTGLAKALEAKAAPKRWRPLSQSSGGHGVPEAAKAPTPKRRRPHNSFSGGAPAIHNAV